MNIDDIPITIGPGSQPEQEGDHLDFLPMPTQIESYRAPILPEPEEVEHLAGALEGLARLQAVLDAYRPGDAPRQVDFTSLTDGEIALIDHILGEGEVSVVYDGPPAVQIQESILAGVWRVRTAAANTDRMVVSLEIGEVPAVVERSSFPPSPPRITVTPAGRVPGVLNAPPVLVELIERSASCRPGADAHVINLTLLPQSPEDIAYLQAHLGSGRVTILSRGFGNCRISATALPNVWWVQYFNSMDTLILNTLEVVDVPTVARAAPEDLRDSAARLSGIRGTLT